MTYNGRHLIREEILDRIAQGLVTGTAGPVEELFHGTMAGARVLSLGRDVAGFPITIPVFSSAGNLLDDPGVVVENMGDLDVAVPNAGLDHVVLDAGCIFQLDFQATLQIDNAPPKIVGLAWAFDGVPDTSTMWVGSLKKDDVVTVTLTGYRRPHRSEIVEVFIGSFAVPDTGKLHSGIVRISRIG